MSNTYSCTVTAIPGTDANTFREIAVKCGFTGYGDVQACSSADNYSDLRARLRSLFIAADDANVVLDRCSIHAVLSSSFNVNPEEFSRDPILNPTSGVYSLNLNHMRCSKYEETSVVGHGSREYIEQLLASERVDPYMDGPWMKVYRQGGPLEWYNEPNSIHNHIRRIA